MYDHRYIRSVLPHRHPILLVDQVEEISYFDRVVAVKAVTGSEPAYARLPDDAPASHYAYPRSLMIESFGQSGAFLWMESIRAAGQELPGTLIFAVAKDVTYHRNAYPGDTLRHVARMERVVGPNAFLNGQIWVGGELAVEIGSVIATAREASALGEESPSAGPRLATTGNTHLEELS